MTLRRAPMNRASLKRDFFNTIGRVPPFDSFPANGRNRRNLVIADRSGEGPFTIRFADVRYRALSCFLRREFGGFRRALVATEEASSSSARWLYQSSIDATQLSSHLDRAAPFRNCF